MSLGQVAYRDLSPSVSLGGSTTSSSGSGGAAPGSSTSQSQSSSFIPQYAESPFLQSIAQYAGQVGSNVYNWAQGEYAKNSNLTDANIHNYLNTSAQALGMAQDDASRYRTKFQPEEDQLLADANSYASNNRKLFEMGAAESGQAQAADAARQNAERDLQSYGIDPSSGRYAALDRAALLSAGAAEAGAAQQARQHTEDVGRSLRDKAIAVGSQYPGRVINSMNTALQGFAGAENAGLANANTGVALQGAANPFLTTASSLKYPPLGTASTSVSASQAYPPSSGGGGSGGGKSPAPATGDRTNAGTSPGGYAGSGGGGYAGPGAERTDVGSYGGDYDDPFSGTNGDGGSIDTGGNTYDDTSPGTNWDGGSIDTSGVEITGDYTGGNFSGGDYMGDFSGGGDYGSYAQGGAIDEGDDVGGIPQDGGAIPQSASPSGGQMVDDVHAQSPHGAINVNADEFVIPRDVALWKGQEFFQKLIAQSRQARVTAPAHPTRGAPAPAQNMR